MVRAAVTWIVDSTRRGITVVLETKSSWKGGEAVATTARSPFCCHLGPSGFLGQSGFRINITRLYVLLS